MARAGAKGWAGAPLDCGNVTALRGTQKLHFRSSQKACMSAKGVERGRQWNSTATPSRSRAMPRTCKGAQSRRRLQLLQVVTVRCEIEWAPACGACVHKHMRQTRARKYPQTTHARTLRAGCCASLRHLSQCVWGQTNSGTAASTDFVQHRRFHSTTINFPKPKTGRKKIKTLRSFM